MRRRQFLSGIAVAGVPGLPASAAPGADLWQSLAGGGHVILMRHAATVPGIGDPPGFDLRQCATQRNLSEAGRSDASEIGQAFRLHAIPLAAVLSSRWCRCLDTARLAFGRAAPAPMLDSMFRDGPEAKRRKLREVRAYLGTRKEQGNIVLVTHDVNIQALAGRYLRQGQFLVAAVEPDGGLRIAGAMPELD